MNWQKWKSGLAVAALTGFLTGIIGLNNGITIKGACLQVSTSAAIACLAFLKSNPIDTNPPPPPPK